MRNRLVSKNCWLSLNFSPIFPFNLQCQGPNDTLMPIQQVAETHLQNTSNLNEEGEEEEIHLQEEGEMEAIEGEEEGEGTVVGEVEEDSVEEDQLRGVEEGESGKTDLQRKSLNQSLVSLLMDSRHSTYYFAHLV